MNQQNINKTFYVKIQNNIRNLVKKSVIITNEQLLNEIRYLQEEVMWSDWGMHGHSTKKLLMQYLKVLYDIGVKKGKVKFLNNYLFDNEIKDARRNLHKQYIKDFKR